MTRDVAGTSESRMGGYDCFIIFLFYVLHVSSVHQFASYLISVHARNMLMSVHARNMLCICVSFLQFCCTVYSFMLVADMRCISCHLFLSVIHESSSHAFDLYKFHMIYDLACIFTMDIIDIMITMINNCLYVIIMLLIYGIKMTWKLPIILTIQKPNFRHFSVRGFAAVLKPDPFDGKNFLVWKAKMELWLTAMSCYHISDGKPANLPSEDEAKFKADDNLFRGAVISALDPKFQKSYIILPTGKELWDALVGKFGVTDAGSELYLMEQLYDYKMVENRSVVEQAHEIQALAKELELFPCVLPDKFVAGGIIAKLPPSWKDFATSLKHKRQEFNVEELIGTLDVEERARAKDNGKSVETSTANVVQKRNSGFRKYKKKKNQNKQENTTKPVQTA